jgi:hypothetical protein
MTPKKTINLAVPVPLAQEFDAVCRQYGHGKQKGLVLSAAILMFLRAHPHDQGRCLEDLAKAEIDAAVARMLDRAKKEQSLRIAARHAAQHAAAIGDPLASPPSTSQTAPSSLPRKAAKKAGQALRKITKLPRLEDF